METEFKILLFPWLAHGHISPFFELAKRLSRRNMKTYICSTPINLSSIQIPFDSSVEFVRLHMPASVELPAELHSTRNLPSHLFLKLSQTSEVCDSIFSEILTSLRPDLLINDLIQPRFSKIASSMGIPSIFFATSSAASYSYYYHVYINGASKAYPFEAINLKDHEKIMRCDPDSVIKDAEDAFALGCSKLSTEIVLVKSYEQVEAKYINYLSVLSKKRLVLTGPLIAEPDDIDAIKNTTEIMKWLSDKPQFSTIYISFGSEYFLSKEETEQIARGLELSNANFLWVIRFSHQEKGTSLEEVLPEGFLQRTKNRGMIVTEWAPQMRILAHPGVGAFISHCGWGSVTESLYFAVPIIAMPMLADQPVNARLLIEAGLGVKIERKSNEIYTGDSIAQAINKVILDENDYKNVKNRAVELSNEIRKNEDGELGEVVAEIMKICMENKLKGY